MASKWKNYKNANNWYCSACKWSHPKAHKDCGSCGKTKEVILEAAKAHRAAAQKLKDDAKKLKNGPRKDAQPPSAAAAAIVPTVLLENPVVAAILEEEAAIQMQLTSMSGISTAFVEKTKVNLAARLMSCRHQRTHCSIGRTWPE